MNTQEQRLAAVEQKLNDIDSKLQLLIDTQRPFAEFTGELGPIASEVLKTSIDQCAHLQERGYFDFARELKYLVDRLVEDYDPGDLHQLADNSANILDTIRSLTQPAVMATLRDATEVFTGNHNLKPIGVFGAYRRVAGDKNVQRGISFVLDVLGKVGRAAARAPRMSRAELRALPHSAPRMVTTSAQATKAAPASQPSRPGGAACGVPDPGAFMPDDQWSREVAKSRADELGLSELSDGHWTLVECARAEYGKSGSTPNIRKLTSLSGMSTREIYTLFPQAPGLTIANIACVPKPAGCL